MIVSSRLATAGLLGVCLFLFLAGTVGAQVNIEDLRPDDPDDGLSGSLGGDVTVQTGNVSFVRVGLRARVSHVEDEVHTLIIGDGGLGFLGSSRFASSGLAHYRKTYWSSPRVAPEWFAQMNYDRSRSLAFRTLVGGGIRSPTHRFDRGRIGVGTSVMLEHERYTLPDTVSARGHQTTARSSSFFTFQVVFAEDAGVSSTTYAQPRIRDWGDIRLLHDLTVTAGITEQWELTVSFDLRYDSRAFEHVANLDTRLRTGITLRY